MNELRTKIYCYSIPFSIFFIIGICCILLGCNTHLKGQCISYNLVYGTVYKHDVDEHTCSQCISKSKTGNCNSYIYYPCYDSYLKYHYNNNQTCTFKVDSNDRSEQSAYNSLDNYPIGYSRYLIKNKNSNECLKTGEGLDTWITGVSFLSLSGLVLLIFLIAIFYEYFFKIYPEKIPNFEPNL